MATAPPLRRPAPLHRKHEPVRGHLHRARGTARAAGRRGHHGCACRGHVPSQRGLGGGGDGEREVVFVGLKGGEGGGGRGGRGGNGGDRGFCLYICTRRVSSILIRPRLQKFHVTRDGERKTPPNTFCLPSVYRLRVQKGDLNPSFVPDFILWFKKDE